MAIKIPASLREAQWTGYKCYVVYLALKLHFSSRTYDFIRYGGKVSASATSYDTRRDRYQFEKLSRFSDPFGVMLAHLSREPNAWIGTISPTSDIYTAFVRRNDALAYTVKEDCGRLQSTLDANLEVPEGTHPYLLSAFIAGRISLETACVLQSVFNFVPYWDEAIHDPIIWPQNRMKIVKMLPFLEFDKEKMKQLIAEKIDC